MANPAIFSVVALMLLVLLQWSTPAFAVDPPKAPMVKDLIEEEPGKEENSAQAAVLKAIPQDEFNRGTPPAELRQSQSQIAASLSAPRNDICFDKMHLIRGVIERLQHDALVLVLVLPR